MSGTIGNEYVEAMGYDLYEKIPKTVLAAVCVAFAQQINGEDKSAREAIIKEWSVLNANGIVPQKPFKK